MHALTLLLSLVVAQQSNAGATQVEHEKAWTEYLRGICRVEGVQIVFDCTPMGVPSHTDDVLGTFGLDMLAARANRVRTEIEGVQVFVRKQPTGQRDFNSAQLQVFQVMANMDPGTLGRLCKDGIKLSDLPPEQMRDLLLALPLDPATCVRAAKGEPMRLALDLSAGYTFKSPGTTDVHSGELLADRFAEWMREARGAKPDSPSQSLPRILTAPASTPRIDGELDLGEGTIKSLGEFLDLASATFGAHYFVDSRLRDSKCFFSGKFTRDRFEATVNAICKVIPLTDAVPPGEVPAFLDYVRKLKEALAQSGSPFNKEGQLATLRKSLSSGELSLASPTFAQLMQQWGLNGREFQVSLVPQIALAVYMPSSSGGEEVAFRVALGRLGS